MRTKINVKCTRNAPKINLKCTRKEEGKEEGKRKKEERTSSSRASGRGMLFPTRRRNGGFDEQKGGARGVMGLAGGSYSYWLVANGCSYWAVATGL